MAETVRHSDKIDVESREAIFRELIASEPPGRKRHNLEIVWQALQQLDAEGTKEFTVAQVGRRVEELGGPRAQSIRNRGGAHFRRLIARFAAGSSGITKRVPLRQPTQVQMAIAQIPDLGVQAVITMALEENRRLTAENNTLRNAYKELSIAVTSNMQQDRSDTADTTIHSEATLSSFDDLMLTSFERFLSERWMEERGYRCELNGSIVDTTAGNILVAPPAFVDGLQCAIRNGRNGK